MFNNRKVQHESVVTFNKRRRLLAQFLFCAVEPEKILGNCLFSHGVTMSQRSLWLTRFR